MSPRFLTPRIINRPLMRSTLSGCAAKVFMNDSKQKQTAALFHTAAVRPFWRKQVYAVNIVTVLFPLFRHT